MMKTYLPLAWTLTIIAAFSPVALAEHRLVLQGNNTLAIVARTGKIEWEMPWQGIHDIHVLKNGNIMVQQGNHKVVEIDVESKKVVWSYDSSQRNGNREKRVEVSNRHAVAGEQRHPCRKQRGQLGEDAGLREAGLRIEASLQGGAGSLGRPLPAAHPVRDRIRAPPPGRRRKGGQERFAQGARVGVERVAGGQVGVAPPTVAEQYLAAAGMTLEIEHERLGDRRGAEAQDNLRRQRLGRLLVA